MKKIEASIRPVAFSAVKKALQALGVDVMTISRTQTEIFVESKSSVKIEVVVADDLAIRVRDVIVGATRSGALGAGRILISCVDEAIDLGVPAFRLIDSVRRSVEFLQIKQLADGDKVRIEVKLDAP